MYFIQLKKKRQKIGWILLKNFYVENMEIPNSHN